MNININIIFSIFILEKIIYMNNILIKKINNIKLDFIFYIIYIIFILFFKYFKFKYLTKNRNTLIYYLKKI